MFWRKVLGSLLLAGSFTFAAGAQARKVEVKILSTMLADDDGFGEWGFSALVTVDGYPILFDTGAHPDTVLRNVRALHVDLNRTTDVILSHNHLDHTAGLIALREAYMKSGGIIRAHVGQGIFTPRVRKDGSVANAMIKFKKEFEADGGTFVVYDSPREIRPGVWLTGPVPRKYPERNWSGALSLRGEDGKLTEDNLPEDQSLVIDTPKGLVVISGCGHAGVINTLEYARTKIRNARIYAAIGGFHLYQASDEHLEWTAGKMKEFGLQQFIGAHCTGIEAVYKIRQLVGLTRKTAVVGAVGAGFTLDSGILPGSIAH
ncbi:MAG TPA: MBL fold metallo-hydrolase [Bryobacteraceae bacterium]|jgi:7,8-dihydropterin-6-yl-methyl-4-(beta-D-ribofuranosyl)aminobenzene 5'-phosphate synthase